MRSNLSNVQCHGAEQLAIRDRPVELNDDCAPWSRERRPFGVLECSLKRLTNRCRVVKVIEDAVL
jgi:hypothetical protein